MPAADTAARPRRGIIGSDRGVEEDLVRVRVRGITTLRLLLADRILPREVEGDGLDLGVAYFPGVDDRTRPWTSSGGDSE